MLLSSILPSIAWCGFETYSPTHTVSSFRIHSDTKYKYIKIYYRPPSSRYENAVSMRLYICSSFSLSFRKCYASFGKEGILKKYAPPAQVIWGFIIFREISSLSLFGFSLSFSLSFSLFLPSFLLSLSFSLSLFFSLSLGFSLFCPF